MRIPIYPMNIYYARRRKFTIKNRLLFKGFEGVFTRQNTHQTTPLSLVSAKKTLHNTQKNTLNNAFYALFSV